MGKWTTDGVTGNPYGLCHICQFRCYHYQLKTMYNGLIACPTCFNTRPINDIPPRPPLNEAKAVPKPSPDDAIQPVDPTFVNTFPPYTDGSKGNNGQPQ